MKSLIILCLLVLALVFGCSTPYKPNGFRGGYTDLNIQDDIYQVSFRGNGYTDSRKVQNFALLRCAEVALENGYRYFSVFGEENTSIQSSFTMPSQSSTAGQFYGSSFQTQTTYYGGQTYNISKPLVSMMIRCFKTKPEDSGGIIYDAETVRTNLRNRYKIIAN